MYYIILKDKALGPFDTRAGAYQYAGHALKLNAHEYAVKSDRVCQQEYLHLPIEPPPVC